MKSLKKGWGCEDFLYCVSVCNLVPSIKSVILLFSKKMFQIVLERGLLIQLHECFFVLSCHQFLRLRPRSNKPKFRNETENDTAKIRLLDWSDTESK